MHAVCNRWVQSTRTGDGPGALLAPLEGDAIWLPPGVDSRDGDDGAAIACREGGSGRSRAEL